MCDYYSVYHYLGGHGVFYILSPANEQNRIGKTKEICDGQTLDHVQWRFSQKW